MRRFLPLVLVGLAAAALGAAAQKLNTYPYLPDELNAPCGKTVLEWNLMAGRIEAEPVPAGRGYELVRLAAEPKPKGIIVRAYCQRSPKIKPSAPTASGFPSRPHQWNPPAGSVRSMIYKRLNLVGMSKHLYILTYLDDRLTNISGNGKSCSIAPDATREDELAALAKIMSHAQAPQP